MKSFTILFHSSFMGGRKENKRLSAHKEEFRPLLMKVPKEKGNEKRIAEILSQRISFLFLFLGIPS